MSGGRGESLNILERARRELDLSLDELWIRYFALGGMSTAFEVEAILHDALNPTPHDHDVLAVALNERYAELGRDHPIGYTDDGGPA